MSKTKLPFSDYRKRAERVGLGLFASYQQPCPAGCGRDRFDHDIMNNPCEAYAAHKANIQTPEEGN